MTTAPTVTDIAVNDGNTDQLYILWSNGRIDNVGGAPAITSSTTWFTRTDQPVGMAMWITNWATGAGYVLDYTGKFNPINGAPVLGSGGYVSGVPQASCRKYVHWGWNPDGSGKGYVVDLWGQLYAFGGAASPVRTGPRWGHPICKRMKISWSPNTKIIMLDQYGGLWADFNAVVTGAGNSLWPGWDAARDFEVIDWATGKAYVLDLYGGHTACSGAPTIYGFPYKNGADVGRRHHCTDPVLLVFWVVWDGGVLIEFTNATAPTVIAGGGTNEAQQVTITGAPTGGSFKLVFGGITSGTIAWNASSVTVLAALQAMSSIGTGNVTVTGGPGPATPWVITFTGTLAYTNLAPMTTSTVAFTGGSSPAVAVTTVTDGINGTPAPTTTATCRPTIAWSYSDSNSLTQAAWQVYIFTSTFVGGHSMTDPSVWAGSAVFSAHGSQPSQRGLVGAIDLANGTYVVFIRAKNFIGLWSAWSNYTWTQAVAPPTAPTGLTALPDNAHFKVTLSCSCSLVLATNVSFQYSDDGGVTWDLVRGAESVPILTTTTATDYDVPLGGAARSYRVFSYQLSPRFVSPLSTTATATITNQKYVLTAMSHPTMGGEVFVQDAPEWSRDSASGVFAGVEAEYPTVVSDGIPKARKQSLTVETDNAGQWAMVKALIESDDTLLLRDPFGDAMYCRIVGSVVRTQQRKRPYPSETSPLRHNHLTKIPLQEVTPPLILDIGYTIPPGPVTPT